MPYNNLSENWTNARAGYSAQNAAVFAAKLIFAAMIAASMAFVNPALFKL